MAVSLPYHEPGIVTILIQTSFLVLLNVLNCILDHTLYCGLIGQLLIGVAWGTPGAKWLSEESEHVIVQLGYLGLVLLIYEGGLSTSFTALKANLLLSAAVAITGIGLPIGLSFVLQSLANASSIQAFAAGAALCSTSLGTTFTVLSTSGLTSTRLGVVLTSAAMMDDVVGLIMVQVISNLGSSGGWISAVTVVRPVFVSLAFAIVLPLACRFVVKPATVYLNGQRQAKTSHRLESVLQSKETAFVVHTLILIAFVTGSTYAGTSNLFAAYLAGAAISWWDSEVPHVELPRTSSGENKGTGSAENQQASEDVLHESNGDRSRHGSSRAQSATGPSSSSITADSKTNNSGEAVYTKFYRQPVERILKPFFFASIGFSIPISKMFSGQVVWKGFVYTILMILGKMACGLWLLRITFPQPTLSKRASRLFRLKPIPHFWGKVHAASNGGREGRTTVTSRAPTSQSGEPRVDVPLQTVPFRQPDVSTAPPLAPDARSSSSITSSAQGGEALRSPNPAKPLSLYPPSIIGLAMVARGEIGFLISALAQTNGIFSSASEESTADAADSPSDLFLIVTWAIVLCTLIGPLCVGSLVRRVKRLEKEEIGRDSNGGGSPSGTQAGPEAGTGSGRKSNVLGVWGVESGSRAS